MEVEVLSTGLLIWLRLISMDIGDAIRLNALYDVFTKLNEGLVCCSGLNCWQGKDLAQH